MVLAESVAVAKDRERDESKKRAASTAAEGEGLPGEEGKRRSSQRLATAAGTLA